MFIWIFLELNTICLCSIISTRNKHKSFKNSEVSIKYFIIQSISSSILVLGILLRKEINRLFMLMLGLTAVIIKLASTPFHQWFVTVTKYSKLTNRTFLITWQKLAPGYLLIFQLKKLVLIFLIASAFVGRVSQLNKKLIIEILALSSIFNLRWIIVRILISFKLFVLFCGIYWLSVIFIIILIKKTWQKKIRPREFSPNKRTQIIVVGSLAGIPPLIGFVAKWIVFTESLKLSLLIISSVLLITSSINLYIYLRMLPSIFSTNSRKHKQERNKSLLPKYVLIANITPIFVLVMYRACLKKGLFW